MATFHVRSNTLPSRPHPLISDFDELLCRLRDSQATSTLSLIEEKLKDLQDLQECIDKLLLLPHTIQALAQDKNRNCVEELIDGSLRILDLCNTAKDALSQAKECALELQSGMRRREGGEIVRKYLTRRKVATKEIKNTLKNVMALENKCSLSIDNDTEVTTSVNMVREVQRVTLDVLKSLLSFVSMTQYKPSYWSSVSSKLKHHKRSVAREEAQMKINEFAMVDVALESFIGCKTRKCDSISPVDQNAKKELKNLELCIEDLEDGTQRLFRSMIKTRVSLLNILN